MCECISAEIKIIKMEIRNFRCGYTKCGREKKTKTKTKNPPTFWYGGSILLHFPACVIWHVCMSVGIQSHVRSKVNEPGRKGVIFTAELQDIRKLALLAALLSLPFIPDPCFTVNKFGGPSSCRDLWTKSLPLLTIWTKESSAPSVNLLMTWS